MNKIRVEILNPEELSVKQESRWVGVYKDGSVGDTEGTAAYYCSVDYFYEQVK